MNEWRPVSIMDGKPEILTAIQPLEAAELGRLSRGRVVLEIGAAHGYSAIIMSLAGAQVVVSVDTHDGLSWLEDTLTKMQRNLLAYNVSSVVIVAQPDRDALPALQRLMIRFGLVFVDGAGDYDSVIFDLDLAKKLAPSGVIAVHDYGHPLYPDKRIACDFVFPEGPTWMVQSLFIKEL